MSEAPIAIEEVTRTYKFLYTDLTTAHGNLAVTTVDTNLNTFRSEKDVATNLKRVFDAKFGGTWQAVVGSCFGCSLTHKTKAVLHFQITHTNAIMYVLLFQSDE